VGIVTEAPDPDRTDRLTVEVGHQAGVTGAPPPVEVDGEVRLPEEVRDRRRLGVVTPEGGDTQHLADEGQVVGADGKQ